MYFWLAFFIMRILEYIFISIAVLGILLFAFLFPMGNTLLVLGFSLLIVFYMYGGFALFNTIPAKQLFKKQSYQTIGLVKIIGGLLFGMTLSTTLCGILFKILSWPGANVLLSVGIYSLLFALIFISSRYLKNRNSYYLIYYRHLIGWGLFALVLYFITPMQIETWRYRDYPDYLKAYMAYQNDPENEAKKLIYEEEWGKVLNDLGKE